MKYFSMFSGIGGFDLALNEAGHECIGHSEIDKYSIQTYEKNFKGVKNYGDATKIKTDELPDFDLLCGGFPCQAFSLAGKRRGFKDTRGTLFFEIARISKIKRPKYLLLENVKGLLNHEQGKTFRIIIQTIQELGYDVQWMVLNSKFFGVPQNRERVFIIGCLGETSRPEILPFRESNRKNIQKTNEYKGQKETNFVIKPVQLVNKNRAKKPYNPNDREMKIKISDDNVSYTVKSSTHECMVMNTLTEAVGIRQGCSDEFIKSIENINKSIGQIRRLTPLEFERLQGFPDNWTEGVSETQRYKQLANAVTVNVIRELIKKLI